MNKARGEVGVVIGGHPYCACLTLGALAEIQSVLQSDGMADTARRLGRLSADELAMVLACLLRGGGVVPERSETLAASASADAAAEAIAATLEAAFEAA